MALVNEHFLKLPGSYLFSDIAKKVNTFKITHPKRDIIRLGIGDVTPAQSLYRSHAQGSRRDDIGRNFPRIRPRTRI